MQNVQLKIFNTDHENMKTRENELKESFARTLRRFWVHLRLTKLGQIARVSPPHRGVETVPLPLLAHVF